MSSIATNPSAARTCGPSRTRLQKRHSSGSEDPLLDHRAAANADEAPDLRLRIHEPRRIVVAIAASRTVDEDDVLAAEFPAPAREARLVGERTQACTPLPLHLHRNRVLGGRDRPGPRRVGEDVDLRDPRASNDVERPLERGLAFGREADDDVRSQVEVAEARKATEVRLGGVAATHRAQDAVVARLQRHVEVACRDGCFTERRDEVVIDVVDLDRRQPEALHARNRARFADQPRKVEARTPIAKAAEVDAGEDDLPMALPCALPDLLQDSCRAPAPRRAADERDHAEVAAEAAPVLDLDECTDAVEARVRLNAPDRADVSG